MNMATVLIEQAQQRGTAAAIIDVHRGLTRTTSFVALEATSAQIAALLAAYGLRKGHTMLMFSPMAMELYAVLLAAFRLGIVAMFLDPAVGREHIARCCAMQPPDAFLGSRKAHLLRLLVPAVRRIPRHLVVGGWVPGAIDLARARHLTAHQHIEPCRAEDPALITFTSGSTGQPKGIVRSHGFLLAQHRVLAKALDYAPGQSDLTTLPIFLLANLASGLTSIIPDADLRRPGAIDPVPVMQQIATFKPQRTGAAPAFIERLCQYCEQHQSDFGSLQKVYVGGAPVFPQFMARVARPRRAR